MLLFIYLSSIFILLSAVLVLKKSKSRKKVKRYLYNQSITLRITQELYITLPDTPQYSGFIRMCVLNVGLKAINVTMGSWLSYMWWGGDPNVVNPVSGLTRREIYAIQKSWKPVFANSLTNGTELLRRLFNTYPDTRDFFKMVRKLPEEQYINNPQFKAHVNNLMTSIDLAVTNLNQPEVVAAMMNKLGESHGRRKIQKQNFHDLKKVIVQLYIDVLHLDDATLAAWGKAVDFWYKHIFETLDTPESR